MGSSSLVWLWLVGEGGGRRWRKPLRIAEAALSHCLSWSTVLSAVHRPRPTRVDRRQRGTRGETAPLQRCSSWTAIVQQEGQKQGAGRKRPLQPSGFLSTHWLLLLFSLSSSQAPIIASLVYLELDDVTTSFLR